MRIFNNIQTLVEQRTKAYLSAVAEDREQQSLNHRAVCGRILLENKRELQAYKAWKEKEEEAKKAS